MIDITPLISYFVMALCITIILNTFVEKGGPYEADEFSFALAGIFWPLVLIAVAFLILFVEIPSFIGEKLRGGFFHGKR